MTRLEENKNVIEGLSDMVNIESLNTNEEKAIFQIYTISIILADISKSLAIIADKVESEEFK